MEKVLGIGGFFFAARNKSQIAAWYETHLGITQLPETYDDPHWRQQGGSTLIHPYNYGADEFGHPDKTWSLNFRVRNLAAMVEQLRAAGITVTVDETVYPNGQFAHLSDPEGNQIELWQPAGKEALSEETPEP